MYNFKYKISNKYSSQFYIILIIENIKNNFILITYLLIFVVVFTFVDTKVIYINNDINKTFKKSKRIYKYIYQVRVNEREKNVNCIT